MALHFGRPDMVMKRLLALDAAFAEKEEQYAAKESRAGEKRRWFAAQREIIRQIIVEVEESGGAAGEVLVTPEGGGVGSVAVDDRVAERRAELLAWRNAIFGEDFESLRYLTPDDDKETSEPVYDLRVLVGKRNNRERALSAARVYGRRLREAVLADAIFRTGETGSIDAASVRGSLGGLVRYGRDWKRERGWLVYQGETLVPDLETILQLNGERQERQRRERQEEETPRSERL